MIFSELYGAYYNAVARILGRAVRQPVEKRDIRQIIREEAFGESVLTIESALTEQRWQLVRADGTTPVRHEPDMPLTLDEKRWIKAVSLDPRIRLFTDEMPDFPDAEPLFTPDDVRCFDRYLDGDPYEDEGYVRRFRTILDAIRKRTPLEIRAINRSGKERHMTVLPERLEYSEKDDKFRLYACGTRSGALINLGRILACEACGRIPADRFTRKAPRNTRMLELELTDRRNALERVLLHFAHFEKQVEKLEDRKYRIALNYDAEDETEMVIRVLSFGPVIRVTEPPDFADQIRERLKKQMSCGR